jgi:hypothetical protein
MGERPPVHDLAAVAIDDLQAVAGGERDGGAVAGLEDGVCQRIE